MFKMAENSLFSILLRSPWWISMAIAATFVILSKAFLPDALWGYGAFGGSAFIVIGFLALKKQWHLPSTSQVEATAKKLADMPWRIFSDEIEKAFIREGYTVKKIDGPADFAITKAGRTGIVSAKRWKAAQHSQENVEALYLAKDIHGATDCTLISLAPLGEKATRYAKQHRIEVMQSAGLTQLLKV
jgi:restriction system protein